MSVYLKDVAGAPLSSFSQGSTQWASGGDNGGSAQFGQSPLFGKGLASTGRSATTPAATSITRAGSTANLGFTDLTRGHGGGAGSGGQMNPVAPQAPVSSTSAAPKTQTGGTVGQLADAAKAKWGPQPAPGEQTPGTGSGQTPTPPPSSPSATGRAVATGLYSMGRAAYGRLKAFGSGATEARGSAPSGLFSASGVADDLAEDVT